MEAKNVTEEVYYELVSELEQKKAALEAELEKLNRDLIKNDMLEDLNLHLCQGHWEYTQQETLKYTRIKKGLHIKQTQLEAEYKETCLLLEKLKERKAYLLQ